MIKYSLFLVLLLTAGISLADSPPPIPNTFSGTVRFSNSSGLFDAPAGTLIEAYIESIEKGNTIVGMSGSYIVDVYGTNEDENKTITFFVNGNATEQNAVFYTSHPPPRILNQVMNLAEPADTQPPESIKDLHNISYAPNYINWTWIDPEDVDFSHVMIYINGSFKTNVTKGVQSYNADNLTPNGSYMIGTRTVDSSGNTNTSWVNHTATTASLIRTGTITGSVRRSSDEIPLAGELVRLKLKDIIHFLGFDF